MQRLLVHPFVVVDVVTVQAVREFVADVVSEQHSPCRLGDVGTNESESQRFSCTQMLDDGRGASLEIRCMSFYEFDGRHDLPVTRRL